MTAQTRWIGSLALLILIALLFVQFVDVNAALAAIRQADWRLGTLASLAFLLGLTAYAQRWRMLLINRAAFLPVFNAANAGHALNILAPLRAGEAARIALLGKSAQLPLGEITASVVVERLSEQVLRLLALGSALLLGLRLEFSSLALSGSLALFLLIVGLIAWALRHPERLLATVPALLARLPLTRGSTASLREERIRRGLANTLHGFQQASASGQITRTLFWSLLTWGCFWVFHLLTLAALGQANLPQSAWPALALGALALAPPSAPTQPGIYHAALVLPLALLGFDRAGLTAFAVLLHLQQMVWMIGLALLGAAAGAKR